MLSSVLSPSRLPPPRVRQDKNVQTMACGSVHFRLLIPATTLSALGSPLHSSSSMICSLRQPCFMAHRPSRVMMSSSTMPASAVTISLVGLFSSSSSNPGFARSRPNCPIVVRQARRIDPSGSKRPFSSSCFGTGGVQFLASTNAHSRTAARLSSSQRATPCPDSARFASVAHSSASGRSASIKSGAAMILASTCLDKGVPTLANVLSAQRCSRSGPLMPNPKNRFQRASRAGTASSPMPRASTWSHRA